MWLSIEKLTCGVFVQDTERQGSSSPFRRSIDSTPHSGWLPWGRFSKLDVIKVISQALCQMDQYVFQKVISYMQVDYTIRSTRLRVYYAALGYLCNTILSPYVGGNRFDKLPEIVLQMPFFEQCYERKDMSTLGLAVGYISSDDFYGNYKYLKQAVMMICRYAICRGESAEECKLLIHSFSDGLECGVRQRSKMFKDECKAQGLLLTPWFDSRYWPPMLSDWYNGDDIENLKTVDDGFDKHRISREIHNECKLQWERISPWDICHEMKNSTIGSLIVDYCDVNIALAIRLTSVKVLIALITLGSKTCSDGFHCCKSDWPQSKHWLHW